ncbi:MAG: hypothetical protein Q9M16_08125 [Mariprofundus sp.]|nr:hypothetical protein [Mariprofundus sp.]
MTRSLRKTLIVSVTLLSIFSLLWLRLGADSLNANLLDKIEHFSDARVQAEKTSLTFMHGIGVRLDQVSLDQAGFHMQAKHINISLRLLPLLLGKTAIKSIDIHDGIFKLKSKALPANTFMLNATATNAVPIQRIHLMRSRIEAPDGTVLLNNLQLDLRGIGSGHQTLWELDAKQGNQVLSGHGQIEFKQGTVESGFGKLKLSHMPVAKLQAFTPTSLMRWLEGAGNQLSGTLTMDISKHQRWAIFGEMLLENKQTALAAKLRGKLSHPSDGKLVWKDSFIHLGQQAVIAIAGSCEQDECRTTLDAKSITLAHWHPFIPASISFHKHISAMSDLQATLQWNDKTWQGKARLELKNVQMQQPAQLQQTEQHIDFPDMNLDIQQLSGSAHTWQARAVINAPETAGRIEIRSNQASNGDKNLEMNTQDADSTLWQPLANLLLSSLALDSTLQANGILQGSLHIHQHGELKRLELDIDASPITIDYKPWINKPATTIAICNASISLLKNTLQSMSLSDCQLDDSTLDKLTWTQKKAAQSFSLQQMHLNLDQLRTLSIPLPSNALSGELDTSLQSTWKGKQTWRNKLSGTIELSQLGSASWQVDGKIKAHNGILSSNAIHVFGDYGNADLNGSFDLAQQRGKIDISAATLDWTKLPQLPEFWQSITLRGKIKQSAFTLLQNNILNVHSLYTFTDASLTLSSFQAALASGLISSNKLKLSSLPNGLDIQGNIRAKSIQLGQLQALDNWLQASLSGSLQANIKLNGRLPQSNIADWQHSNGDILIYSGSWQQHAAEQSLTEQLLPTPSEPYAFKKLEFRFRVHQDNVDISDITLLQHGQTYRGQAIISPDLHLSGQVQNKADKHQFVIDSDLPQLHWTTPPAATSSTMPN